GHKLFSSGWREMYRHALHEAARLGITVGVNLSSGWCMGGPWIEPGDSGRWFLQSALPVQGPQKFSGPLPLPGGRDGYDKVFNPPGFKEYIDLPLEKLDYRDTAIVAFPVADTANTCFRGPQLELLPAKTNRKDASNFIKANDVMGPVLQPLTSQDTDTPVPVSRVIDLSDKVKDGYLQWEVPAGNWIILRTGHRMTGSKISIAQPEADGLSVDWLSAKPVDLQFEHFAKIILEDAGPLAGTTLKFFGDDSFEDGFPNWTGDILQKFEHYRGYDPLPYLPVLNGYIVGSAAISDRFLHDYRKTVADCMADEHYGHFAKRCHEKGLLVNNEAAGPSRSGTMCMDGLKNLGKSDLPCGEFWLGLKHDEEGGLDEHQSYGVTRLEGGQNKVTKMTASAAHIYGKKIVSAESFTTFRHWLDYPGNMKQATDRAFCEGINRFLIHAITCTRPEDGQPGYEYGAGTHFNPNVTWWNQSGPFLRYIARCQYLLRQGFYVADVLYYNGDEAPNLVRPKHIVPTLGRGYEYDACNEEVLLTRSSVSGGRIVLPDGMSYRLLVLPDDRRMPPGVLKKIKELVQAGATVIGPAPEQASGLLDYPTCDEQVKAMATELWGPCNGTSTRQNNFGKGRIYWNMPEREVLLKDGVMPDLESEEKETQVDFIHRRLDETDIYFIANRSNKEIKEILFFRVDDKIPELWDPVTGEKRDLQQYGRQGARTRIPFILAPFQSFFILFSRPAASKKGTEQSTGFRSYTAVQQLEGAWMVQFDPKWGGPASVLFDTLSDWTMHLDERIKFYSGKATYRKQFDLETHYPVETRLWIDLGLVKNIASVRLNGKDLGIVWTSPWRVEITGVAKEKGNQLEIDIVNLWPNRLIGDAALPPEKRITRTNIALKNDASLLPSGLLGPVVVKKEV
ncbi:MAG TPA: glycosyl hydrolase, partial [Chitinophagaceae bacterium]